MTAIQRRAGSLHQRSSPAGAKTKLAIDQPHAQSIRERSRRKEQRSSTRGKRDEEE